MARQRSSWSALGRLVATGMVTAWLAWVSPFAAAAASAHESDTQSTSRSQHDDGTKDDKNACVRKREHDCADVASHEDDDKDAKVKGTRVGTGSHHGTHDTVGKVKTAGTKATTAGTRHTGPTTVGSKQTHAGTKVTTAGTKHTGPTTVGSKQTTAGPNAPANTVEPVAVVVPVNSGAQVLGAQVSRSAAASPASVSSGAAGTGLASTGLPVEEALALSSALLALGGVSRIVVRRRRNAA